MDVGACSTRPGSTAPSPEEEMNRLRNGLRIIRRVAGNTFPISIDTYRADVARMCIEEFGVQIINDISGGNMDDAMFRVVADTGTPYILTHMQGASPQTMQNAPQYADLLADIAHYFSERLLQLRSLGAKDIILDPGFGFGKTLEQNYRLLAQLRGFEEFQLPILVGISRKSMICKALDCTPEEALNGTTALHMASLVNGAGILRVHDVKEAKETVRLFTHLYPQTCSHLA